MKIVCDTCGTKYSIDGTRIAGKSFKIRCKQCAHVILLPDARAALAETLPAAGAWYVVTDSTPRPVTLDELRRLQALGKLDDRSLVWREGFLDWCELGTVEELRAAPPCTVVVARDPGVSLPAAGAPGTDPPTLRNQRNESSVLFTLGNLARLAAPPSAASAASSIESSGLLDIRSIARSLVPGRTERGPAADVPVFGEVTFGDPAVLVPRPPPTRDRRLVWALAASVGALAIVTAILVVMVLRSGGAPAHAAAVPPAPPAAPAVVPPPPSPPAAPAVPAAPGAQPTPPMAAAALAAAPTVPPAPAAPPPVHVAAAGSRRAAARASSSPPVATRPVSPAALPAPPEPVADSCSEVTCVVNGYADPCCQIYRQRAGAAALPSPGPGLPDSLDRPAVAAGLSRIDTSGCRHRSSAHGDVAVSVKVSPAGSVTAVTVRSSPDPQLSACVTAAAREGSFARTQRGGSFAYVWRF